MLNIHLEYCDDKGQRLEQIAKIGEPFGIFPVPTFLRDKSAYHYPEKIIGLLKELGQDQNSSILWGQQGYSHHCPKCTKEMGDTAHENYCFYNDITLEEQIEFMSKGKRIIEDKIGVSPRLYCPPNHMYDNHTKIAATKLNFEYLTDQGILNIFPYKDKDLVILPERKLGKNGEIFYVHYDQMQTQLNLCLNIIKNTSNVEIKDPNIKNYVNQKLKFLRKRYRDYSIRKGYK
jgi:hypothetical protein